MRIAEDVATEQIQVLTELSLGVKPAPRVVQVNLAGRVKPRILACSKVIKAASGGVCRGGAKESRISLVRRRWVYR